MVMPAISQTTNNTTVENNTTPWEFNQEQINKEINVGTTTQLNLSIESLNNQSETVNIETTGNLSDFIYSIQSPVQTIPNQKINVLNQLVVDRNQKFGEYNGTINASSSNHTDQVNVSLSIVDDVKPEIVSTTINDLMALTSQQFTVEVKDNLNISNVYGEVIYEKQITNNNTTVKQNETLNDFDFNQQDSSTYTYTLNDSDTIGQYYLKVNASDTSNNTVSTIESFRVNGLESIQVKDTNPVFNTVLPKESTEEKLLESSISGKEVRIRLDDLQYFGNETVRVGVVKPSGGSAEILEESETVKFTEDGVYKLKLIHSGNDEIKGKHRVNGEINVLKPDQHVEPRNVSVSFSGRVKNVDKPPATTTRVEKWDAAVAYSMDEAVKLYEERFGNISDGGRNESLVYSVQTIPVSECEGSNEWERCANPSFGEVEETVSEAKNRMEKAERTATVWKIVGMLSGGTMIFFIVFVGFNNFSRGTMEAEHKVKKSVIGTTWENPEDIETGRGM